MAGGSGSMEGGSGSPGSGEAPVGGASEEDEPSAWGRSPPGVARATTDPEGAAGGSEGAGAA